ncbi:DUF2905 domain-containing protein [Candidatus Desulforudis audaxviator]|uniref:DUF2905 domain-containing protein n=1 Tax=Desulforudis audaxviator (strain MP104C) TaxID=477974 RepID=B1I4K9_DESAP|nr:DUF2905 domain-containing protein [Candidatus Desulforudis audaxviator]ACA59869.1 conserved hypothetical protein [Candidatus Desulforudis audaxviator MP104C]AZK59874.1 hypothetical protein Daudx_1327 [Candidatus Desulforudis audaxviator]
MDILEWFGRTLIIVGVLIVVLGALLYFGGKILGIGRLPGDILIQRGNFTLYFPLATAILLSIILTLVLNLFFRR